VEEEGIEDAGGAGAGELNWDWIPVEGTKSDLERVVCPDTGEMLREGMGDGDGIEDGGGAEAGEGNWDWIRGEMLRDRLGDGDGIEDGAGAVEGTRAWI
jgi:hypothetical protein